MAEPLLHKQPAKDRPSRRQSAIEALVAGDQKLAERLARLKNFSSSIRVSEYHVTDACNLRCRGCWFFEFGHDAAAQEEKSLEELNRFIDKEKSRQITSALLIGGEPTLFPERVRAYARAFDYVTVSSNGLRKLPFDADFETVNIMLTLFGGGPLDDELRAIKPGGQRFSGLFETVLDNYRNDDRACFVYGLSERGLDVIEETIGRIAENGNRVTFNYYSEYDKRAPIRQTHEQELLSEALRVKTLYPETVVSHPMHIRAVVTGGNDRGSFGYHSCPSVSVDHPGHSERRLNGNPTLPLFNAYKSDLKSVEFCCTSGHCDGCRDSQAVYSWLLVNVGAYLESRERLVEWIEMAESYWSQFIWSPYHPAHSKSLGAGDALSTQTVHELEECKCS
ncbi:radical SAM protein [Methylocystis sp. MJC1]|uniref:radical SAM protein n=1 Tax=Methylocystis sp. MJC1 TaxID=2654282 RepID=UPI0013EE3164|nr:radical SAM protein [Methylocystis sp. MJC1]KAF2991207.1 hypothetical protein MJC1_01556 [Methylocystis sp. MJC1]MBU6526251.1 radical SAM protein [Methylocystis sp. MJC1]UZX12706.1 radical SAM protein [Methylocystis sp. MJC1]